MTTSVANRVNPRTETAHGGGQHGDHQPASHAGAVWLAMKCGTARRQRSLVQNDLALLQTFRRRPAHGQLPNVDPLDPGVRYNQASPTSTNGS